MASDYLAQFDEDGYLLVEGLLDRRDDVEPFRAAYTELIDALAHVVLAKVDPERIKTYGDLPLPERFATLLGASGGSALHHLDPVLNSFLPNFQPRRDLPSAQIPALLDFIVHPKVLDVLEELIGPEIAASPIYHINFKLAKSHVDTVQRVAAETGQTDPVEEGFFSFQVGQTGWHMDSISGLHDSYESRIVNAWVPITRAAEDNGCLLVIPGSHLAGVRSAPTDEEMSRAIPLAVNPGDVVFLDNKVFHSSTGNVTDDDYRWAFNFRYLPVGQPSGRSFLPGFVARSRSDPGRELRNPYVWNAMWQRALDYLSAEGPPYSYTALREGEVDLEFAKNLTKHWNELAPDEQGWLRLESS